MRLWRGRLFLSDGAASRQKSSPCRLGSSGGGSGWSILGAADWEGQGCQGWKAYRIPNSIRPYRQIPQKAEVLQPDEAQPERNVEWETPGHKRMGHGSIERTV